MLALVTVALTGCGKSASQAKCQNLEQQRQAIHQKMDALPSDDIEAYNRLVDAANQLLLQERALEGCCSDVSCG